MPAIEAGNFRVHCVYKKVARSLRNLIYPILSRFALAGNVDGMMLGFPLANIYILLMIMDIGYLNIVMKV